MNAVLNDVLRPPPLPESSTAVILKLPLNLRKTYSDRSYSVDEGAHRCFAIGLATAPATVYFCGPASDGDVGVKAKENPEKNYADYILCIG